MDGLKKRKRIKIDAVFSIIVLSHFSSTHSASKKQVPAVDEGDKIVIQWFHHYSHKVVGQLGVGPGLTEYRVYPMMSLR